MSAFRDCARLLLSRARAKVDGRVTAAVNRLHVEEVPPGRFAAPRRAPSAPPCGRRGQGHVDSSILVLAVTKPGPPTPTITSYQGAAFPTLAIIVIPSVAREAEPTRSSAPEQGGAQGDDDDQP